jgi:hypothetical protein
VTRPRAKRVLVQVVIVTRRCVLIAIVLPVVVIKITLLLW